MAWFFSGMLLLVMIGVGVVASTLVPGLSDVRVALIIAMMTVLTALVGVLGRQLAVTGLLQGRPPDVAKLAEDVETVKTAVDGHANGGGHGGREP